jgi:anti-anti-sigma factor
LRQQRLNDCIVTVTALAGSRRADIRIAGDVDVAAVPVLTDAVRRLSQSSLRSVFVDLAGVTFAGSVLPDFLKQAHDCIPRNAALVVCRVSAPTRRVLAAAGMLEVVTVCDDELR